MTTRKPRGRFGAGMTLACVVLVGGVVAGHHSQTGFDPTAPPIDVKGTVVEYRWRNPHVLLFWDAKDQDGTTERWVVEFASVASSLANGMKKDTFKVGEEITATCIRARAGGPVCAQAKKIVRADGSPVTTAAPD